MIYFCRTCGSLYHALVATATIRCCPHCPPFHATGPPATEKPPAKKPKRTRKD